MNLKKFHLNSFIHLFISEFEIEFIYRKISTIVDAYLSGTVLRQLLRKEKWRYCCGRQTVHDNICDNRTVDVIKIDNSTPVVCLVYPYSHYLPWSGLGITRKICLVIIRESGCHSYLLLPQVKCHHMWILLILMILTAHIAGFSKIDHSLLTEK